MTQPNQRPEKMDHKIWCNPISCGCGAESVNKQDRKWNEWLEWLCRDELPKIISSSSLFETAWQYHDLNDDGHAVDQEGRDLAKAIEASLLKGGGE